MGSILIALGAYMSPQGLLSGNLIALTYILISLAELMVSATGLSMIGLYCDSRNLAFAMGTWYLGCSLSNTISAWIARWVAIPTELTSATQRLIIYQDYYATLGGIAAISSLIMFAVAYQLHSKRS